MAGMTPAGIGFLVDGLDRHHPHQPLDPFAVHRPAVAPQHRRQPPRAIERPRQMQLVHPPHHRQVVLAHWRRPVIQCRARHLQQPAPAFAGAGYCATTGRAGSSWSTSASRSGRVIAQTFCEKNPAPPSAGRSSHTAAPSRPRPPPRRPSRWRGSARTARPCHPAASSSTHGSGWHAPRNRLDSSATVPSSRTAASATFALKSAPCRFRVLVMSHLRPDGRSKGRRSLSYLSSFRGPPQVHLNRLEDAGFSLLPEILLDTAKLRHEAGDPFGHVGIEVVADDLPRLPLRRRGAPSVAPRRTASRGTTRNPLRCGCPRSCHGPCQWRRRTRRSGLSCHAGCTRTRAVRRALASLAGFWRRVPGPGSRSSRRPKRSDHPVRPRQAPPGTPRKCRRISRQSRDQASV